MNPTSWLAQVPEQFPATITPLVSALVSALAAVAVLAWAWREDREPWLGWLIVSWLVWVGRYAIGMMPSGVWPFGDWVSQGLQPVPVFLLRDFAFVMAMAHLGARPLLTLWGVSLLPVLAIAVGAAAGQPTPVWAAHYIYLAHGLLWLTGAVVVGTSVRLHGRVRLLAAAGLAVHALVVGAVPWAQDQGIWRTIGLGLSSVVHLSVALGVGIGVHQRLLDQRELAELRVARALEYVVRGMVPMCAYCRSVRSADGGWTTLEAFVGESTEAPVLEVRCPDCAARV